MRAGDTGEEFDDGEGHGDQDAEHEGAGTQPRVRRSPQSGRPQAGTGPARSGGRRCRRRSRRGGQQGYGAAAVRG